MVQTSRVGAWVLVAAAIGSLGLVWGASGCGADGDSRAQTSSGTGGSSSSGTGGVGAGSSSGTGGGVQLGGGGPGTPDADGDGISDEEEGKNDPGGAVDTDGDGKPDYQDTDSDDDGLLDADEGTEDWDGDSIPNFQDPYNDGDPPAIELTAITTNFNNPIGIDYHEPTNSVVISANWPNGTPSNFERIEQNGDHTPFSTLSGYTDEVKIATVRPGNGAGFVSGDLFVGNGVDGQIVRIGDSGQTVDNPWVDLPGGPNGLMRGSLYVDRTGLWGWDLVVVTTVGQVWRIDASGTPTKVAEVPGVHLEGTVVVPDAPVRFGPLAGKVIAGAEEQGLLYAFDQNGGVSQYAVGVNIEDIDLIPTSENFFGVNFGTGNLLGATPDQFQALAGDVLLTQEMHSGTGLYRLKWDGANLIAQQIPLTPTSAAVGQWEHVTFAPAGINEIPVVPPPS